MNTRKYLPGLFVIAALLLGACGGAPAAQPTAAPPTAAPAAAQPTSAPAAQPTPTFEPASDT